MMRQSLPCLSRVIPVEGHALPARALQFCLTATHAEIQHINVLAAPSSRPYVAGLKDKVLVAINREPRSINAPSDPHENILKPAQHLTLYSSYKLCMAGPTLHQGATTSDPKVPVRFVRANIATNMHVSQRQVK